MASPDPTQDQSQERSQDGTQILTGARESIYEIRRQIETLRPSLTAGPRDTFNAARQELCGALVRRLEIAESEVQQLIDMLDLDRTAKP
jgi:hypothetical protein